MRTATIGTAGTGPGGPDPDQKAAPPLRRLPVPISQPRPALRVVRDDPGEIPAAQGMLALDPPEQPHFPGPGSTAPASTAPASTAPASTALTGTSGARSEHVGRPPIGTTTASGRPTRPRALGTALPDPGPWAGQFVQAALEVASGLRPVTQLIRWTNEDVRAMLGRRAALARRPGTRARQPLRCTVRSTRACRPRDGVAEASVVIADGERFRAVALRLEASDGRWRVTALRIG